MKYNYTRRQPLMADKDMRWGIHHEHWYRDNMQHSQPILLETWQHHSRHVPHARQSLYLSWFEIEFGVHAMSAWILVARLQRCTMLVTARVVGSLADVQALLARNYSHHKISLTRFHIPKSIWQLPHPLR